MARLRSAWLLPLGCILCLLGSVVTAENNARTVAGPRPILVDWSRKIYGPDGPWHALNVSIGTPAQFVDLQFAHLRTTWPLAPQFCGEEACPERRAGYYRVSDSHSVTPISAHDTTVINRELFKAGGGFDWPSFALKATARPVDDTLRVYESGSPIPVDNCSIVPLSDARLVTSFAGENNYPLTLGGLSIGAPVNEIAFLNTSPPWPQTDLIPALWQNGRIPSASFAYSLGSPSAGIAPQLILGGYDAKRMFGKVLYDDISSDVHFKVNITQLGIGTEYGESPFEHGNQNDLLQGRHGSLSTLTTSISFLSPYLTLPKQTCFGLMNHLPILYRPELGIFLWNVKDDRYQKIFSSPSYLYLNLANSTASPDQQVQIKIPFRLLNLTLQGAIPIPPTPYFPCSPVDDITEVTIGKAFLQAVVIGINWATSTKGGTTGGNMFIAQRGGPGEDLGTDIRSISTDQTTVFTYHSASAWSATWKGYWDSKNSPPLPHIFGGNHPVGDSHSESSNGGLSTGKDVGIAIGVAVAVIVIALLIACFFYQRRRKAKSKTSLELSSGPQSITSMQEAFDKNASSPQQSITELPNQPRRIWELPGQERQPGELESPVSLVFRRSAPTSSSDIVSPVTDTFTSHWPSGLVSPLTGAFPTFSLPSNIEATLDAHPTQDPPSYPQSNEGSTAAELEDPRAVEKSGFLLYSN